MALFSFAPPTTRGSYQHDQYLRKWQLSLNNQVVTTEQPGYDLRMRFRVRQADQATPNTAEIRVYNLADTTAQAIVNEGAPVTLQAGYLTGNYGTIFAGQVKQYKRGKESAVDSYLDIFAADGDLAHVQATINKTIAAGAKIEEHYQALSKAQQDAQSGLGAGASPDGLVGGTLPRGRVLYGMVSDEIRDFTKYTGSSWSIQNGMIQVYKNTAYAKGEAVVLNAQTGLISMPEETQEGIMVTCLLNPKIQVKGTIHLDNASINQYNAPGGGPASGITYPGYSDMNYYAATSNDGLYTVYVIDYEGDTRELPWYNHMVCLANDTTSGTIQGAIRNLF